MAKSFGRAKPHLKPQPKVLVICEDSKSGKRYLEDASRHFRAYVQVEHCGKTYPLGIVNEALLKQKKFDQIYCVIDRDTHPDFDAALAKVTGNNKIQMIVSYPCYEFWLLLHFGYSRKPYAEAAMLVKDLRKNPGFADYDKGQDCSVFKSLLDKLESARRIAVKVLAEAEQSAEMNPSTRLHQLLDRFEKLGKPQEVDISLIVP